MSTKLKHQQTAGQSSDNVTALPSRCSAESCSKKSELMSFCKEHYDWFKFGLLTKEGKRPVDFDKKYLAYQKKHAA